MSNRHRDKVLAEAWSYFRGIRAPIVLRTTRIRSRQTQPRSASGLRWRVCMLWGMAEWELGGGATPQQALRVAKRFKPDEILAMLPELGRLAMDAWYKAGRKAS